MSELEFIELRNCLNSIHSAILLIPVRQTYPYCVMVTGVAKSKLNLPLLGQVTAQEGEYGPADVQKLLVTNAKRFN
jgi:hypothetical protein